MATSVHSRPWCVVGAGYTGLPVAAALLRHGVPVEVLEAGADVGGIWLDGVYDSARLVTSRDGTAYPGFPMPADTPVFPDRAQMLDYLRTYAADTGVRDSIRVGARVVEVQPLTGEGLAGWRVRLADGRPRRYAGVVLAHGQHRVPLVPSCPGRFAGVAMHSSAYRRPTDLPAGTVVVVGAGNSGADIALEAARSGRRVLLSVRSGNHIVPRELFGRPTSDLVLPPLPAPVNRAWVSLLLRGLQGRYRDHGLPEPEHRLFQQRPVVHSELLAALDDNLVEPRPAVRSLAGRRVHFVDGTSVSADAVVWATGFQVAFPFLDRALLEPTCRPGPVPDPGRQPVPPLVHGLVPVRTAGVFVVGTRTVNAGAGRYLAAVGDFVAAAAVVQGQIQQPLGQLLARCCPPTRERVSEEAAALRGLRRGHRALASVARLVGADRAARGA